MFNGCIPVQTNALGSALQPGAFFLVHNSSDSRPPRKEKSNPGTVCSSEANLSCLCHFPNSDLRCGIFPSWAIAI